MLRLDAAAVVAHLDGDVGAGRQLLDLALGQRDVAGADPDLAGAGGHGLDRVDDEVLENLENLGAVDADGAGVRRDVDLHLHGGAERGEADGLGHQFRRLHYLAHGGAALGEGKELLGQRLGGEAGLLAVFQAGEVPVLLGHRDAAEDGGEQVVEIVRDAAGQLAEEFKTVGPNEFFRRQTHFLGIAEHDDHPGGLAAGAQHRPGAVSDRYDAVVAEIEGEFIVERGRLAGCQRLGKGTLAVLAALAVHEVEDLGGVLAGRLVEGARQQSFRLGVEEDDLAIGVGQQHTLMQLGEQDGQVAEGQAGAGLMRDAEILRQRHGKPEDALQFFPSRDLADDAGVHQDFAAVAVAQAQGVEIGDLVGVLRQEVGRQAAAVSSMGRTRMNDSILSGRSASV